MPKGYAAMAVFPFVILRDVGYKENKTLINHEKIHLRQQAELLIIFFFLWYAIEYLLRFIRYREHDKAYRNISFEHEAYTHEHDGNYLKNRTLWNFAKFL